MKVLLFTHKVDIDGMGCAILGNLAFDDITIVYSDTFEINQQIQKFIDNKQIDEYDKIFVTDLCIKKPLINIFEETPSLREKTQIIDHHKAEIDEGNAEFSISHIVVENENGKCSGTSLFYEYLIKNSMLEPTNETDKLVELTRQYDTWEWKSKFNNESANDLNIVFAILRQDLYVQTITNKLKNNETIFDDCLIDRIEKYKKHLLEKSLEYLKNINIVNIGSQKIGVIENMLDEYKNDVAELIKEKTNPNNLDIVAMIIENRNVVVFRAVSEQGDVGKLASTFGGKGHKKAGSCPRNEHIMQALGLSVDVCEK